jgi:hypothetical protein
MPDTPEFLSERLRDEGAKTLAFFRALTPQQWETPVYTEDAHWSVRHVLAHFVAAESGITRLVENILAGGQGTPEDFDLNAYNERKVNALKEASREELLEKFSQLRQLSSTLVRGLHPEDLAKSGRHPWLGPASLGEIVKLMYRHNQIHQRDIRKAFESGERSENG